MPLHNSAIKLPLACMLCALGLDSVMLEMQRKMHAGKYVRLINYHDTPPEHEADFRQQVELFARKFSPVSPEDLHGLITEGRWDKPKPGAIISFDDGIRTNYDVATPILESLGFRGWYFIPTVFIDTPAVAGGTEGQFRFVREHAINTTQQPADGRLAMNWDEIRDLVKRGHTIGSHTRTHHRMVDATSDAQVRDEIIGSKAELQQRLGSPVDSFCWVGGEEASCSAAGGRAVREAGYRFALLTCSHVATMGTNPHHLHRTNIESDWPIEVVRMMLTGIPDLVHNAKRKRVERRTGPGGTERALVIA